MQNIFSTCHFLHLMSNNIAIHNFHHESIKFSLFFSNETIHNTDKQNFAFFLFLISRHTHTECAVIDPCTTGLQKYLFRYKQVLESSRNLFYLGRRGENMKKLIIKKPSQKEGRAQYKSVYALELQVT